MYGHAASSSPSQTSPFVFSGDASEPSSTSAKMRNFLGWGLEKRTPSFSKKFLSLDVNEIPTWRLSLNFR